MILKDPGFGPLDPKWALSEGRLQMAIFGPKRGVLEDEIGVFVDSTLFGTPKMDPK